MNLLVLGDAASVHLRRMVRPFAEAGHRVIVAGFAPGEIPGATVVALPAGGRGLPLLRFARKARRLRRIIVEERIDLVHAHAITVYGLLALACGSVPKVLTVHGSDVLLAREKLWNRAVIRWVSRRVDRITSPAAHVTDAFTQLGAFPDRIDTFQYGVDLHRFHPAEATGPRAGAPLRVISTRALAPLYQVDLLLMALSRVACRTPLRATIAGGGPEAERLERLAWSLGLEQDVRFAGVLGEEEVAAALREADVYVSTAPTDGASLGLLEAMATGLLPVVADIPANREWVRQGENGLLFAPGSPDALAEAMLAAGHDRALCEKARARNPEIIRERSCFDAGIKRISGIYEVLLRKNPKGGRS